jgi:hypothetical protein
MLTYAALKERPREFLAATGMTHEEFTCLLPAFASAYTTLYPPDKTRTGEARQRQRGGGAKAVLSLWEDKLLFILVYQKTNPLQTMHALQFGLSQPQANYWIHHLVPVLQQALAQMGHQPERDATQLSQSALVWESEAPDLLLDGTERRRQRPQDPAQQRAHYSGKKKAHTDKNVLLVHAQTHKVVYLGATLAGKTHDKKAADEAQLHLPANTTLGQDSGFQGYAPAGVLSTQPQKSHGAGS